VRREVLLGARDSDSEHAERAIATIAATYDGTDRYQLEAINVAAAGRKMALLARLEARGPLTVAQFPLLQLLAPDRAVASLLERLADEDLDEPSARLLFDNAVNIPSPDAGWGLLALAQDADRPLALRTTALERVLANVGDRGAWSQIARHARFSEAMSALLDDDALRPIALRAVARLRLKQLANRVVSVANNDALKPRVRAQAVHVAARLKPPGVADALNELLDDSAPQVAQAALDGLVAVQDIRSLREILGGRRYPESVRQSAATQLVASTGGALVLLRLIDEKRLPPEMTRSIVAKAVAHPDANVRVLYEKFVPEDQRPKKLGKAITSDDILSLSGDAGRGRLIFFKSSAAQCNACHAVQGFGSTIGPELSNIGKKYERKALLETILQPSKAIAPEYVPYLLVTKGGQVFAGFLVERTEDYVLLKDIKNQRVRVEVDEIEALVQREQSLMPELVLSEVTAQDAADLLEFLTNLK
jgi:putative heme-binding domain-containing protein